MLIPNHPHDERLAALASADADAVADEALSSHVASCIRCTGVVTDLGALRASLADLPDLRPSRPLRLLPDAEPAPDATTSSDRLTGWVRRIFAPLATAGAALAMVGLVGTASPALPFGAGGAGQQVDTALEAAEESGGDAAGAPGAEVVPDASDRSTAQGGDDGETYSLESAGAENREDGDASEALTGLPERSPWPMVLFSGVALVIVALLLRWIVVPRAG
jgi:hypothetical protein